MNGFILLGYGMVEHQEQQIVEMLEFIKMESFGGTYNADIGARAKSGYTNPPEKLPQGDHWPLAIGEGLHGFSS